MYTENATLVFYVIRRFNISCAHSRFHNLFIKNQTKKKKKKNKTNKTKEDKTIKTKQVKQKPKNNN